MSTYEESILFSCFYLFYYLELLHSEKSLFIKILLSRCYFKQLRLIKKNNPTDYSH